jgi:CPA1 family monovalent cation:H+ antiporter
MSWREFRFNLRPIVLLAVGGVVFTAVTVGAAAHLFLGVPWPVGLTLGAIVSPPDAMAPLAIVRRLRLPRRLAVILEGEGLVNDATALILYRFAVIAVSVGSFSLGQAVGTFALIVAGEIVWGIAVGWTMLRLRRWVDDVRIEILLSLLTPFAAYWPPEHVGGSGVLATVAAGLYISWNGLRLIGSATRLQGIFFWDFFIYAIEGMVFLGTGLQARALKATMTGRTWGELVLAAAIICGVVIVMRFVWVFPATHVPRWFPRVRRGDPAPPWQATFFLSATGIRGIVSLAAALALPETIDNGAPFPHRDLILFLTFSVILVTLVGQGLVLPAAVRALGLADAGKAEAVAERHEELAARRLAIEAAEKRLKWLATNERLPESIVRPLHLEHADELRQIELLEKAEKAEKGESAGGETDRLADGGLSGHDAIAFDLIKTERALVNTLYRKGELKDEARRRIERELDLREATLEARSE